MSSAVGNILGNTRAEADKLLDRVFVQTSDYRALISTDDFHFVVGRRGTGKSALFKKVREYFVAEPRIICLSETPAEHHALAVQTVLAGAGCNYRSGRAVSRLLWRSYLLERVARQLLGHFKLRDTTIANELRDVLVEFPPAHSAYEYAASMLKRFAGFTPTELPGQIANITRIDRLQNLVSSGLLEAHVRATILFDSLDEGWLPEEVPTSMIGGLALAATDLRDASVPIHVISFVRDNMFRALANFDSDFSRHIEGSDLRLRWDVTSLLHIVAQRLRVVLETSVENDLKVWSRFAKRGLEGRSGFENCLQNTLYRPRDVLSLLNMSFQMASREGRTEIIDADVSAAASMISGDRLSDLLKEYDRVFPGVRLFVEQFQSTKPLWKLSELMSFLDEKFSRQDWAREEASDFALLGSASDVFLALYSVGFLGLQRDGQGAYVFCHDGASADLHDIKPTSNVAIHPCYWRGLDLQKDALSIDVLDHIYDEYSPHKDDEILDVRMQRLGQVVEELPRLSEGAADASAFEDWVLRALRIVFAGHLANIELHPGQDGIQRRDLVATIVADRGFWRRILEDYGARQVVFEIKNHAELKPHDFRQALSYSGREYGQIVFLIYRTSQDTADENERSWLQEIYQNHNTLIFLWPAKVLQRFISKRRAGPRNDYWESTLTKMLDTHIRAFLRIKAGRKPKRDR